MDSDSIVSSIEHDDLASESYKTVSTSNTSTNTPRPSFSPEKTPFKTPLSHPATPTSLNASRPTSRRSTPSRERQKTPNLHAKRSNSNLNISRETTPQPRRTSSNLNPASPGLSMKPFSSGFQRPPAATAGSVAREYFTRELEQHHTTQSEIAVFVHDSCYGHRFSRPKTTKAALSTIVERPERIHATLLGASTAYVRLGERHAAGSFGPSPTLGDDGMPRPPFSLRKTSRYVPLNHAAVTAVHGTKWMEELQIMCDSAEAKLAMNGKELTRPIGYGKDESGQSLPKLHEGDLYLCSESLSALQGCLGGVCEAVDTVFNSDTTKKAFVCIRPPGHHCSSNYPSGFCWLNNVHVGITYAAMTHDLTHAAIFDFDLHHGDGSQTIAWNHNRDSQSLPKNAAAHKKIAIGYYSLHDINSYPCEWGDEDKVRNASLCLQNAHGQSIWNVHLEPWKSLEHFWELYEVKYAVLLDKARGFLQQHSERLRKTGIQPKAAIFLSAGFDASQWEGEGMQRHSVNVPTEFYARFSQDVAKLADETGLGVDGRIVSVLEGGYSDRALTSGVLSHLCGLVGKPYSEQQISVMANGTIPTAGSGSNYTTHSSYDPTWWSSHSLEALEAIVAGNIPPAPKKHDKQPGNYSSPTHASTARMTDQARERKSLSAQLESRLILESAPLEPPPEVDWVTASYELCRLLIPGDRQTLSCHHDELNAEATRVRRERQSGIGLPVQVVDERMQLRDRRSKPATGLDAIRASSRNANRRTTIAAVSELPDPSMGEVVAEVRPRRRSSAASSILSSFQDMALDDKAQDIAAKSNNGAIPPFARDRSTVPTSMKPPAVKKVRAVPTKKAASRTSSPVKGKGRETRTPPSNMNSVSVKSKSEGSNSRTSSLSRQNSISNDLTKDDMDDLTNGMKKVSIKLKLPTPEQHAENQKKAEEEKRKKARAPRKPPVPKPVKTKPAASSPVSTQAQKKTPSIPAPADKQPVVDIEQFGKSALAPVSQQSSSHTGSTLTEIPQESSSQPAHVKEHDSKMSISSLLVENPGTGHPGHAAPVGSVIQPVPATVPESGFGPVRPRSSNHYGNNSGYSQSTTDDTSMAAADMPPPPPIRSPNKKTKADLPVFTSSSPIPFQKAVDESAKQEPDVSSDVQQSIWEIPDTPQR